MLSHLRFHRRAPSNPASPLPDQAPAWDAAAQPEHPQSGRDVSPRRPDARPRSPSLAQKPPTLPPITRVASTGSDSLFARLDEPPHDAAKPSAPPPPTYRDDAPGFIGGVALQNYRRTVQTSPPSDPRAVSASHVPESQLSRAKPPPPPINTSLAAKPMVIATKQSKSSSFVTPTDLQQGSSASYGKRPGGPRFTSEPTPSATLGPALEPQKGRKGLPFLKNPMTSLLMRRKTANGVAESQLPEPSYDPRIRGTRVHDFSAPRPKKAPSNTDASVSGPETAAEQGTAVHAPESPAPAPLAQPAPKSPHETPPVATDGDAGLADQNGDGPSSERSSEQSVPPAQPKDASMNSIRSSPSATSKDSKVPSASVRTTASRQMSASKASRRDSVASAVPKHMKSTSSRFSFDMIGSASQEKLLEERHRQREQEKKTSDDTGSRFDDFDEDSFDYDAMMDDDGLEERIPGVNVDYEEEEDLDAAMDPDNDQENFAGFVFQRSNPASSLATPHTPAVVATPRDADGEVIGFAMTKDTTTPTSGSHMLLGPAMPSKPDEVSGHAIQGLDGDNTDEGPMRRPSDPAAALAPKFDLSNDDIYFDDGLADELDFEHDGTVFDESIFDNNDTDQYGRPIPGAFAQAQAAMKAAQLQQQLSKRDSDITSDLSGQSGITQSTGHTSLSVGSQQPAGHALDGLTAALNQLSTDPAQRMGIPDQKNNQDLAYQAALAEAAQRAAASGKFRRSSSPDPPPETPDTPPLDDSTEFQGFSQPVDDDLANYEDDPFATDFGDDFDFDDEAIIAEANASALANDSDGFYGQEFGFYSAPIPQHHLHHHSSSHQSSSSSNSSSNPLSTENLFHYSAGGYFGPAGASVSSLGRSTSGRVVCREPNLTPITERSEYSNRNSVMSFTLPPAIGDGSGGGPGSGRSSAAGVHQPGLAQLAMMESNAAAAAAAAGGGDGEGAAGLDWGLSLEGLMRYRSRAWGGSGSVSGGAGSPREEGAAGPAGSGGGGGLGHRRVGSGLSSRSLSLSDVVAGTGGGAGAGGCGSPVPPGEGTNGVGVAAQSGSAGMGGQSGPGAMTVSSSGQGLGPGLGQTGGGSACSPVLEGEEAAEVGSVSGELGAGREWEVGQQVADGEKI